MLEIQKIVRKVNAYLIEKECIQKKIDNQLLLPLSPRKRKRLSRHLELLTTKIDEIRSVFDRPIES